MDVGPDMGAGAGADAVAGVDVRLDLGNASHVKVEASDFYEALVGELRQRDLCPVFPDSFAPPAHPS
jgi:hypothetical protein